MIADGERINVRCIINDSILQEMVNNNYANWENLYISI